MRFFQLSKLTHIVFFGLVIMLTWSSFGTAEVKKLTVMTRPDTPAPDDVLAADIEAFEEQYGVEVEVNSFAGGRLNYCCSA